MIYKMLGFSFTLEEIAGYWMIQMTHEQTGVKFYSKKFTNLHFAKQARRNIFAGYGDKYPFTATLPE